MLMHNEEDNVDRCFSLLLHTAFYLDCKLTCNHWTGASVCLPRRKMYVHYSPAETNLRKILFFSEFEESLVTALRFFSFCLLRTCANELHSMRMNTCKYYEIIMIVLASWKLCTILNHTWTLNKNIWFNFTFFLNRLVVLQSYESFYFLLSRTMFCASLTARSGLLMNITETDFLQRRQKSLNRYNI